MWADIETSIDFLNFGETADLVADLIDTPAMLPLSVGIFGGWGAGKSSLLRLLENRLVMRNDILIVEFDAWLYQGFDDARAALMEVIAARLRTAAGADKSILTKIVRLSRRVNYLRLAGLMADTSLALATGGLTYGMVTTGLEMGKRLLVGNGTDEDAKAIRGVCSSAANTLSEITQEDNKDTSPQKQISALREEFSDILKSIDKCLVVFIDNLDRCLPRNAIQTLEAIRLFLFLPKTAFVVAADEDMIRHAVKEHYNDPTDRHVSDYLDKLIQIPVRVPRLGVQEITAYLFLLFATARGIDTEDLESLRTFLETALQACWKQEPITSEGALNAIAGSSAEVRTDFALAERLAPILAGAPKVQGNPRIVKRLLNTIRMRSKLAARRKMPLDETIIAKLALFERCTDEKSFTLLCSEINDSRAGKPEIIEKLESLIDTSDLEKTLPDPWKEHKAFLREWLLLPPSLLDIDLRSAVYLSREIAPLRVSRSGLSASAMACFKTLMTTNTKASPAAKRAITAVDQAEHLPIMEALVNEMRRATDWQMKPAGLTGATALADTSPAASRHLMDFLVSIPGEPRPLWLKATIQTMKA